MNYDGLSYDEILDVAEELIDKGDLHEAKAALDAAAEESGRKYFIKTCCQTAPQVPYLSCLSCFSGR